MDAASGFKMINFFNMIYQQNQVYQSVTKLQDIHQGYSK